MLICDLSSTWFDGFLGEWLHGGMPITEKYRAKVGSGHYNWYQNWICFVVYAQGHVTF